MGWTRDLWNIGYHSLTTPTPFTSQKILFNKRALHGLKFTPTKRRFIFITSHLPILEPVLKLALPSYTIYSSSLPLASLTFYGPPSRASRCSAIHIFLVLKKNWVLHLPWSELSEKPKHSGNLSAPVINYGSRGKENTSARKMRAVVRIQIKIRGNQR